MSVFLKICFALLMSAVFGEKPHEKNEPSTTNGDSHDLEVKLAEESVKITFLKEDIAKQESALKELSDKVAAQEVKIGKQEATLSQSSQSENGQCVEQLLKNNLIDFQNTTGQIAELRQTVNNLAALVTMYTTKDEGQSVAFMAKLSADSKGTNVKHESVVFNAVLVNVGGAFNPTTGVFTCPRGGLYVFIWSITSYRGQKIITEVAVNGIPKMTNHNESPNTRTTTTVTSSAVVVLEEGDRVWIWRSGATVTSIHGGEWSSYLGFNLG